MGGMATEWTVCVMNTTELYTLTSNGEDTTLQDVIVRTREPPHKEPPHKATFYLLDDPLALTQCIICVVLFVLNLLIVLASRQGHMLQRVTRNLVIQLGLSDMLVGIGMASMLAVEQMGRYDKRACQISTGMVITACFTSICLLTVICLERVLMLKSMDVYSKVFKPHKLRNACITLWIFTILLGIFPVVVTSNGRLQRRGCRMLEAFPHFYLLILCLLYAFLLITQLATIIYVIFTSNKQMQEMFRGPNLGEACLKTLMLNFRTTRTLLLVTVLFLCSWCPMFLFVLWCVGREVVHSGDLQMNCSARKYEGYVNYGALCGITNSFMNFFIYLLRGREFREALMRLCGCKRRQIEPIDISLQATVGSPSHPA